MKVSFMIFEIRLFGFRKVSETFLKELIRTLACSYVVAFSVKTSIYLSHEDIKNKWVSTPRNALGL